MYFLASRRIKCIFSFAASFFVIAAVVNTFVFSGDYGVLSRILAFAPGINLRGSFLFWGLNAVVMVFLFCAAAFLWGIRRIRWLTSLMAILLIAGTGVSVWKAAKIQEGFISYRDAVLAGKKGGSSFDGQSLNEEVRPVITLSETGKNVVVLMLDRAISSYLPLIFEERPELKSAFEGFTYYPNTVSYAPGTILGAPPIFGGYDYTPQKLQARKDAVMAEKHNEAILFLPALLRDKGYTASVFDLPYGNYQFIQDISFFTSRGIFADNILGRYDRLFLEETNRDTSLEVKVDAVLRRNFIMFSFFSASPVVLRPAIYRRGSYWNAVENDHQDLVPVIDSYAALYYLPKLTQTVKEGNSLVLMANYLTHSPGLLQYPDYTIPPKITDTGPLRFNEDVFALRHYHVNAAAYLLLSKWFSRLREMGVYDNTRIIIAADHGQGGIALPRVPDDVKNFVGPHNPVLLVKDFDAKGALKTVTDFMTNADAALCALQGIVPDAVNPFTGNAAVPDKENGATLVINAPFNAEDYEGYAALKSSSQLVHVKDNIFDIKNWGSVFTWKE
jgi:hypothetical protein